MLISLLDKQSQASVDSAVGFWLLTKDGNDIFNEHGTHTRRIPSDLPAGSCQFPRGRDLAAGHHLLGLVQCSLSHGAQKHTRVPHGTKQTRTTSLDGDKEKFGYPGWR